MTQKNTLSPPADKNAGKSGRRSRTPIARNQFTVTKELFTEGKIATLGGSYRKAARILCIILILVLAGTGIWMLFSGGSLFYLFGEILFTALIIVWLTVFVPRSGAKRGYRAMISASDKTPERTTLFYHDHFTSVTETGKNVTFLYKDVENLTETKSLWVMTCKNKMGVMIKKDGFTLGNMDIVKEQLERSPKS